MNNNQKDYRFECLIDGYRRSPVIKQMDAFYHHGTTTTLEHSKNVAWASYQVNKKLHLHADEFTLIKTAMLHDLYLYDRFDGKPERKTHRIDHPDIACKNAERYFGLSKKEKKIIRSHMWPLNITRVPSSKEAVILCAVDKYCATLEKLQIEKLETFVDKPKQFVLQFVK